MNNFKPLRLVNREEDIDLQYEYVYEKMSKLSSLEFWHGNPSVELISGKLYFSQNQTETNILAVISIPENQEATEFSEFSQKYHKGIKEIRILKTSISNYYTQLIIFESRKNP
jgi:hypothetical protein